jgi:hypothetical protein
MWLILFRISAFALFCKLCLTQDLTITPTLKSEEIRLVEQAPNADGEHRYLVSLPEQFRNRHFTFHLDHSVCNPQILVNGNILRGEDATDVFRFDNSNQIVLTNCIERTPAPLQLFAHPKVYISVARGSYNSRSGMLQLDVTIRNTLLNSVSLSLEVPGRAEDIFVGPETSQACSISVHLREWSGSSLSLVMHKYPEAIEGEYRHIRIVSISRIAK